MQDHLLLKDLSIFSHHRLRRFYLPSFQPRIRRAHRLVHRDPSPDRNLPHRRSHRRRQHEEREGGERRDVAGRRLHRDIREGEERGHHVVRSLSCSSVRYADLDPADRKRSSCSSSQSGVELSKRFSKPFTSLPPTRQTPRPSKRRLPTPKHKPKRYQRSLLLMRRKQTERKSRSPRATAPPRQVRAALTQAMRSLRSHSIARPPSNRRSHQSPAHLRRLPLYVGQSVSESRGRRRPLLGSQRLESQLRPERHPAATWSKETHARSNSFHSLRRSSTFTHLYPRRHRPSRWLRDPLDLR